MDNTTGTKKPKELKIQVCLDTVHNAHVEGLLDVAQITTNVTNPTNATNEHHKEMADTTDFTQLGSCDSFKFLSLSVAYGVGGPSWFTLFGLGS